MRPRIAWRIDRRARAAGAGGALLLPIGRLALLQTFPRERLLPAMSFVAIPGLVGPLIGPTLGGWLVEVASWHWIFLINVPIGIVGGFFTLRHMRLTPGHFRTTV
ncbi:MAG: MFS transporter [Steroidobacteraceae bacterium]